MKTVTFLITILLMNISNSLADCGEIWFFIDDNNTSDYKIVATRNSPSEPLFGINFMEVDTDIYNEVVSDQIESYMGLPPYDYLLGFDYLRDQAHHCWPFIGEGKLIFSIYRNEILVFRFKIDLVHAVESPDISFHYSYTLGTFTGTGRSGIPVVINYDDFINCWDLHNHQRNIDYYENDVELTNGGDYGLNNNVKIIYQNSTLGFPYDNYPVGTEFAAGTHENFWRGARYNLTASHNSYNFNNILYKFRNWDLFDIYSTFGQIKIRHETSEISAMYNQTHPITVVNNLEGGNGGNYNVTWNQMPNNPEIVGSNVAYNGFVYNPIRNDIYSLEVADNFPALNTTWYFQKWNDGSTNNIKSNIEVTAPQTYTAYYKGIQRSDQAVAYANNGQRKFIRTPDECYHHVYESMDRVWWESSTDQGATWELMNDGIPLDDNKGKLPSIDFNVFTDQYSELYQIVIVYQEKYSSGYKIRLKYFHRSSEGYNYYFVDDKTIFTTSSSYTSSNADPVISLDYGSTFTIVYSINTSPGGFYCRTGYLNYISGIHLYGSSNTLLSGPDEQSYHPTLDVVKGQNHYLRKLAWEQNIDESSRQIYYGVINGTTLETYEPISDYSGFSLNFRPSILATVDGARISWVGYRNTEPWINEEGGEGGMGKASAEAAGTEQKVIFADPNYKWYYWNFGQNVQSTNINRSTPRYIIAWGEGDNSPVQFVDSWDLGGTIYYPEDLTGKFVQVCNGNDRTEMRVMAFNTAAQPYYFNSAQCYNTAKVKTLAIGMGREGVVSKDSARFFFALGDLMVNGQNVPFIEVEDTVSIYSCQRLNELIISEPFNLNDNTNFIYSVQYGITDSSAAVNVLDNYDFVSFKVELRDDQTGELLGLFDNITYNETNVAQYNNIAYQVNTQGIGNRTVRLKLVTDNNFNPKYSIADRYAEGNALLKTNFKQVSFQGSLAVDNYDLSQNYPNPFNPTTTINYQIKEDGLVTLKIFDILGSEVKTLVNEEKTQGRYSYNFNASDLASGVYIYQLRVNDFVSSKKLLLLK